MLSGSSDGIARGDDRRRGFATPEPSSLLLALRPEGLRAWFESLSKTDRWPRGSETLPNPERFPIMPSTVIRSFAYDPAAHTLDVQFVSGRRYAYLDVPEREVEAMRRATSKGGFFNRRIRDRYRFERR